MLKIAVFYNKKPAIAGQAKEIIKELTALGYRLSIERLPKKCDLVLALGGDGTYLRAAHKIKETGLPLLAVRLGRLGFLAELESSEVVAALEKFRKKKYKLDKRSFLEVAVYHKTRCLKKELVLNEVVLCRAGISRLFDVDIIVNDQETHFRADGIIISTVTGSTAYNLSAGGPILAPQNKKYIITPICPHAVNWRSLVVRDSLAACVVPDNTKKVKLLVTFDGYKIARLKPNSSLTIKKAEQTVNFLRFKTYNFNKIFKEKFGKTKKC